MTKGVSRARFGAISWTIFRSDAASRTRATSPMARYRRPPWIIFDERLLVPEPKSLASIRATERPRIAASLATPAPVMPPPITATSKVRAPSASNRPSRPRKSSDPALNANVRLPRAFSTL